MTNKYNLSRHIPKKIAREVRLRSKFACVNCRNAIYQYEHIDPEFNEATEHDPEKICLLCGSCHDKVTRGRLSKETIRKKYQEVQGNNDIKPPFDEFDLSVSSPVIRLGTSSFEYAKKIIVFGDETILSIDKPENGNSFPTISGSFYDNKGTKLLEIQNNEWISNITSWDIVVEGNKLTIFSSPKEIVLEIVITPPNQITITKMDMLIANCHLLCDNDKMMAGSLSKSGYQYIALSNFISKGADVGVFIPSGRINFNFTGVRIEGGKGIILDDSGIIIGKGSHSMNVMGLKVWNM